MRAFEYQIDRGIPAPPAKPSNKYPWPLMEIGDSFFVPHGKPGLGGAPQQRVLSYPTEKYACLTKVEQSVKGVRVWRVA